MVEIELRSLRLLCILAKDEISLMSPQHPLLIFQDRSLSEEDQQKQSMRFYSTYGPKGMDRERPPIEDQVSCYREYYADLQAVILIKKAMNWGKLI